MSLRHALLGFLSTEPASGYDLAREFSDSTGWFWYASHSQIYPELHRLAREGLVSVLGGAAASRRRVYALSAAGRAELARWLEEPGDYPPVRDVARLKLLFLDAAPVEAIRAHLEAHRRRHAERAEVYAEQLRQVRLETFGRVAKRLASRPDEDHDLVVGLKVLALRSAINAARCEVDWADDALGWLEGVEAARRRYRPPSAEWSASADLDGGTAAVASLADGATAASRRTAVGAAADAAARR